MSNGDAWELGRTLRSLVAGFAGEEKAEWERPTEKGDAFPPAGIDAFLSHFVFTIRINKGEGKVSCFRILGPLRFNQLREQIHSPSTRMRLATDL
jgi:hypothetical protein